MNVHIRGGRLVDPSQGIEREGDLWVENGKIAALLAPGERPPSRPTEEIDARGMIVAPGLIDLHTHLREPGQESKEDIESGTRAAVAGGFTSILCMPNTNPVNDTPEVTRRIVARAREAAHCRVYPVGAVTIGLEGKEKAPLSELRSAGCIAFSDDGNPVTSTAILREALVDLKEQGVPLIEHCEDPAFRDLATIHDGEVARELGIKGLPVAVETSDVARTIVLGTEIGTRLHLAHLSCAASVDLLREFKGRGAPITAEAAPHHLLLTDSAVREKGTNAKMYPPLRTEADRQALVGALSSGLIDAVATDHAPHTKAEKDRPYAQAPNGVIGLETALPTLLRLVADGKISLSALIERMSTTPARIAGIPGGTLRPGSPADVVVFSFGEERAVGERDFRSKSRNTPFLGYPARGSIRFTFVGGKRIFPEGKA